MRYGPACINTDYDPDEFKSSDEEARVIILKENMPFADFYDGIPDDAKYLIDLKVLNAKGEFMAGLVKYNSMVVVPMPRQERLDAVSLSEDSSMLSMYGCEYCLKMLRKAANRHD
jgi:hypothetical protein